MNDTYSKVHMGSIRTKKDLQQLVNESLAPLASYFTPGKSGLDLGATGAVYNKSIERMEAFARPLWGLAPLAHGGGESDLWAYYVEGLVHGTDPNHEEYWGSFDKKDQRMVEMAAIGLALALAPDQIWHPLTDEQKWNVHRWLDQVNVAPQNPNNWLMFTILVNLGFKRVGMPHNQEKMEEYLNQLDTYYLSDGWYSDGKTDQRDYYIAFAMQFYTLIYAQLNEQDDPVRAHKYRERAKQYAQQYMYWFAEDGSSIPFGRSLTYRFAQGSFWCALVYAGVEVYSLGVMKGMIMRHLRWWFSQHIFDKAGLLSIGYTYPNLIMAENYNAPGSPYWAYKAFLLLALPDDHPFWVVEEEEMPELDALSVQPHARMLLHRPEGNTHAVALTAGQLANFDMAHNAAKYAKFAYSTLFGFSCPKGSYGLYEGAYDSMLALAERDEMYRVRRKVEAFEVTEDYAYTYWKPWHDVDVHTWLIPAGMWHVRVHQIQTKRPLDTAEGGFAVSRPTDFTVDEEACVNVAGDYAIARFKQGTSGLVNLLGERNGQMIYPYPNTNVLYPRTALPTLTGSLEPGEHLLICAVFGSTTSEVNDVKCSQVPEVSRESDTLHLEYVIDDRVYTKQLSLIDTTTY
ncbi:DUF2264 domain-containing protein [Paenibacillus sp. N1-5-1-14]|uniref:DUF2264 domain-containing protein n=1 Tax=Paenibacillus radicibacter TaxID=2972488 RepID=UPI00215992C0|nr:DUF2264 domain-containing protein [Paenibacillus radicibacter]MCR8642675.1 DUF2264 domain-containing protein [Paenibacillus radicibacter]